MKPQHLLLVPMALSVDAFSPSYTSPNTFQSQLMARPSVQTDIGASTIASLERQLHSSDPNIDVSPLITAGIPESVLSTPIELAEVAHGMPWRETIGDSDKEDPLLYMPFWEWQLDHMKKSLTNLQTDDSSLADFGFKANEEKKARIVSQCYKSDEYRKIRMTYYDAGDNTQVFNSVWYPDPKYNLPVLGIDLLAFNRKKYLAIVDFQPIHENEEDHACTFEHRLSPIKNQYESLKGRMSSKFYDETQFFSQEMLFARFEDEEVVSDDLFPAFKRYVMMHNRLIRETEPNDQGAASVLERQTAYDTYSAERDPATGLFAAMFGKEWADEYVFDFLFSLSEKKEGGLSTPPMFGGPPQGAKR